MLRFQARAEARAIMARANETLAAAKKESEAQKRIVQTWMIEDKQVHERVCCSAV